MSKTRIYGYSDDGVIIDGFKYSDEYGCYSEGKKGIKLKCSDGTKGIITYDGEWKIEITEKGIHFDQIINSIGDDNGEFTNEEVKGCTPYSDVLLFKEDALIEWIKIGTEKFKP